MSVPAPETVALAQSLWDYHRIGQPVLPADLILCCCSNDADVAAYTAELWHTKVAPWLMFSGGVAHANDLLATDYNMAEAEMFASIARQAGVPDERIILETAATNSAENIARSRAVLSALSDLRPRTILLVQKPFMERRMIATARKVWPEIDWRVTSRPVAMTDYMARQPDPEAFLNIMVGDLQRLRVYADRGFMVPQDIPGKVWRDFETLVRLGYDKHLVSATVS